MQLQKVSIIGNRAYPHNFIGTSGIEVYTENIVTFFPKSVKVLMYVKSSYQSTFASQTQEQNIQIKPITTIKSKVFESVMYSFFSSVLAAFDQSSVVWYHGVGQAMFAFFPRILGKKVILTVHGEDWKRSKWSKIEQLLFTLLAQWVFMIPPHKTFVVARQLQKKILLDFSILSTVAYPGITKNTPKKYTAAIGSIEKKLGITQDQYLLYLGRIVPEKRLELLIDTFIKLSESYPKFKLVIAGGHGNLPEYETSITKRIENSSIIMPGYIFGYDKAKLLQHAKALIVPSEIEGNSVSVMEALSLGKQVLIAQNCLENSFYGVSGIFTFRNGTDFHSQMEKILKTKTQTVVLPKSIYQNYSWERTANSYLKEILRVIHDTI